MTSSSPDSPEHAAVGAAGREQLLHAPEDVREQLVPQLRRLGQLGLGGRSCSWVGSWRGEQQEV